MSEQLTVKPLNSAQYDAARAAAITRIQARIGERPTRKQYRREMGSPVTILDVLAAVVFLAALAISSAHIVAHMGAISAASFPAQQAGIVIDLHTWATVHQVAAIFLAEASAVLFAALHSMGAVGRAGRRSPVLRLISVPGALAVLAGLFVLAANLASGVDLLTAVLPPIMTLGIAVRLEAIAVTLLKRNAAVDERYTAAIAVFEQASADPTAHPEFMPVFRQEVYAALCKRNPALADAERGIKWAAVAREMARETEWHAAPDNVPEMPEFRAVDAITAPTRRNTRKGANSTHTAPLSAIPAPALMTTNGRHEHAADGAG